MSDFLAEVDEAAEPLWDAEPYDPFDEYERQDDGWGWP